MVTKRDSVLLYLLMSQAALSAATASANLAELAPPWAVATVGLLSSVLSAVTGVYVVASREPERGTWPPSNATGG